MLLQTGWDSLPQRSNSRHARACVPHSAIARGHADAATRTPPRPATEAGPMSLEWMGYVAATCTTLSFIPQAAKTIRTRDTSGISLWMYVVFTFGIMCWFGYGIFLGSWPMIVSNAITFVLSSVILALKLKHG